MDKKTSRHRTLDIYARRVYILKCFRNTSRSDFNDFSIYEKEEKAY
jgi:hypothetical protein